MPNNEVELRSPMFKIRYSILCFLFLCLRSRPCRHKVIYLAYQFIQPKRFGDNVVAADV